MTYYTRWRLYILGVFVVLIAGMILIIRLLRSRGFAISNMQAALFIIGAALTAETLIIAGLSNFNLGVILPAFFGLPLMAMAFLLPRMDQGFLLCLKWFVIVCYAAAALIFLICGYRMRAAQNDPRTVHADAVIVLGAAVHGDRVTWVLENRLNTAMDFLNSHPGAICVVSGGQGRGETVTEASAMKKYMVNHGIDPARVYLEEQATSTVENFRLSKPIIDEACGPEADVAFVTTNFHVYRASRVAASQGIDAKGIPAPDVWYLALNNFMRESVGICVYALRGDF